MRIQPIIPARRAEPFDDPAWAFELKLDGFRCIADTVGGRLLSKHRNEMKRFRVLLEALPQGYIFDGEIVCLDETGRPIFNDLLFRRRDPVYVLDRIVERYGMQKSELFFSCGKSLFRAVCELDLEGIVAKKVEDPYEPERTKWWKILNPGYSQKAGRAELFERRYA